MTSQNSDARLEALLEYLSYSRGFDFRAYKRAGLRRRIEKRMFQVGVEGFEAYQDYLEVHQDEFAHLFDTFLINVTSFFRDPEAWKYLDNVGLPRLLDGHRPDAPIRIWSAGCSNGAEAFTLALLLVEKLGVEAFRQRVKIYATDIDDEALAQARAGIYTEQEVESVPPDYLARYFTLADGRYTFRSDLRRSVIFGKHNLLSDAPISHLDLLVCRNVLMYLNSDAQHQVLLRFHYALKETGLLFLGKAEMLLTRAALFVPLDLKTRLFTKVPLSSRRERVLATTQLSNGAGQGTGNGAEVQQNRLCELSFQSSAVAQIVVDPTGTLILINERAGGLFGLAPQDIGRPVQDLEVSYRPLELRSLIDRVALESIPILVPDIARRLPGGETQYLEIQVIPLLAGETLLGTSILFTDQTPLHKLREDVQQSRQELETAYEELQSTNEELETTNEELQSTNEELETTNEELQSTNEELETMNEELQSTNEELETMNEELRARTDDLNQANAMLEAVLGSVRAAVVVVDNNANVLIWNTWAEELWGLRGDEVRGQSFLTLDIGLPVDELAKPVRACLTGECPYQEILMTARNRRGKAFTCRVALTPFLGVGRAREGAILLMSAQCEDIADTVDRRPESDGAR